MQIVTNRGGPDAAPGQVPRDRLIEQFESSVRELSAELQARLADGAVRTTAGRNELNELRQQIADASAQLAALRRTEAVAAVAADADAQILTETVEGPGGGRTITLGSDGGRTITMVPPRAPEGFNDIPKNVRDLSLVFIVAVALTMIFAPLVRAWARGIDRRGSAASQAPDMRAQLERMERAIDTMAVEVERISEGQRFATRLLAEREKTPVS